MLRGELRDHAASIPAAFAALPLSRVLQALVLTVASYAVLVGFDQLAFVYVGKRLGAWRIALASFVSYAVANNVGFALISGTSIRYRFYSRWGVEAGDLSRIVVFYSVSFWLGLLTLGGWSLAFHPHPAVQGPVALPLMKAAGAILLILPAAYVGLSVVRRAPFTMRGFEIALPTPRLAFAQLALSVIDWMLAAAVLHALLPDAAPHFGVVLGAFIAAQLAGLASHIPGGMGVFEGVMLVALRGLVPPEHVISALLLYRVVYYLLPLTIALVILVADEARLRRRHIARVGAVFGSFTTLLAPKVLAVFTFLAGVVLLFSGALPADPGRLKVLARFLPLGVFEASHFMGSVVGIALLFVAQGVARRLDVAYYLAVLGLALGIAFSLLKAGDYEEALLLGGLLLAFVPARREFDRRAALFDAPFSPGWTIAAVGALGATIWLGVFAYEHVEYADELWWRFAIDHDAPRFLRSTVGATVALLAFGAARLMRPAAPQVPMPTPQDMADVERIVSAQQFTLPSLAYLGDKALLFNEGRSAFLMYGVQGRTWVALGDPVGPADAAPGLIRQFLERADDFGGLPVFYQVRAERLHGYVDFGLASVKLGEEARVSLADFSLEGGTYRGLRTTLNRMPRDGMEFEVVPRERVPAIMDELREVSDEWLASKGASEKGFSMGVFDPAYIVRFAVAVIRVEGRIVAFSNVWSAGNHDEMSVDLMRFRDSAPKSTMEALFASMLRWGKEQGYAWFSLGMAPLAGLEVGPIGHAWARGGRWFFRHGGAFYNFQGLRNYKDKFHPQWHPRYLAYPGGMQLPRILADIAALIAGGYRRIFR